MQRIFQIILFSCAAVLITSPILNAAPIRLICDTDIQTDCDDAGALAALHALADRGEVDILATMVCVPNPWSASCVDAINTYYGRPDLPIGQLKGPGVLKSSRFVQGVAENFPNDIDMDSAPDAVELYREILAGEPDNSVVILTLGYMTNLQDLLNSPADEISPLTGAELIEQKVKVWVCMGGNFPDDYLFTQVSDNVNFRRDADAAIDCITNWPGRIDFVGREIGHVMRAGARLSQTPNSNPVKYAYELYFSGEAKDRHCADIVTTLYAVRGLDYQGEKYWKSEDTGSIEFTNSDARFKWVSTPDANQAYIIEEMDHAIIEELLEDLMIQSPSAIPQWGRFETELTNTQSYSNPYLDVTLNVTYTAPDGTQVAFWGFHDGGQSWKLRYMPNQPGTWQYNATFSDGQPGKSGTFECVAAAQPATITAYEANPHWFGQADGSPFLVRSFHAAGLFKFSIDDPSNPSDGEKRTAFLDWAQAQGYNTLSAHFFSTRNATDSVGPKLWPLNYDHFRKVEMILDDLSDRGMVAYAFTGFFGNSGPYPPSSSERTAYIRYCLARFGPYWNIIMNVGGFEVRDYLSDTEIRNLGAEIANANPFGHLLGAHQRDGNDIFRSENWCSFATLQDEITNLGSLSNYLLNNYAGKPVYGQETLWVGNSLQPNWSLTDLRKHMWVHMMSAVAYNAGDMNGNNESGFGGSLDLSDKIQARHDVPKMIWDFMETVPYYNLSPRQDLRSSGYLLANPGDTYLCYLPNGGSVNLTVDSDSAPYTVTWINAQDPMGDQRPGGQTTDGQSLAAPDSNDWLVYLSSGTSGGNGPEITVTGNGANIVSGDTTPDSSNGTDFGAVVVNGGSTVRTFTILNSGNQNLTLGTVTLSGGEASDFTVNSQPASTVAPGTSTTFAITFDPSASGIRSATISFDTNDDSENPFVFAVRGYGGNGGNTIVLYHFDETAGSADPGNPIINYGIGGTALNLTDTGGPDGRDNTGSGGYGASSFPGFETAIDILATGDGTYKGGVSGSSSGSGLLTAAPVSQSDLQGTDGAFTYEALVKLGNISDEQNILSHDGPNGSRGFLFRVVNEKLAFYDGISNFEINVPVAGSHAFVPGNWYHVAVSYSGNAGSTGNLSLYWTALNASPSQANLIGTATLGADLNGSISNKLGVGTTTRSPYRRGGGVIDEVRVTGGIRSAADMAMLWAQAEISVTGNGESIASGDTTPDAGNGTDYGTVAVNGGTAIRTYTIINSGGQDLTVGAVSLTGDAAMDFTVTTQPNSPISPQNSITFSVAFSPSVSGLRSAEVSFATNDVDENPFVFSIQGNGELSSNTIALYHFDETAGSADPGNPIINYGSGGTALNLTDTGGPDGRDNTGPGGYGAASYDGFGTAIDILATGDGIYNSSSSGSSQSGGVLTEAAVSQSDLQGLDGAFTYEALVKFDNITDEQNILGHDGPNGSRGFLFRVIGGNVGFYDGNSNFNINIPSNGIHAFAPGKWYHIAVSYSGNAGSSGNLRFYWTALDTSVTEANLIGTETINADLNGSISNKLGIGTTTRSPFRYGGGIIDEVRITGGIRGASEMAELWSQPQAIIIVDADQDGMPDTWENLYGLDSATPNATTDTDRDGMMDLTEFALGLNPVQPDVTNQPKVEIEADYLTLTVKRNENADNLSFIVEVSDDLVTWVSGPDYITILEDTPSRLKARDNIPVTDTTRRFIRLRVIAQP